MDWLKEEALRQGYSSPNPGDQVPPDLSGHGAPSGGRLSEPLLLAFTNSAAVGPLQLKSGAWWRICGWPGNCPASRLVPRLPTGLKALRKLRTFSRKPAHRKSHEVSYYRLFPGGNASTMPLHRGVSGSLTWSWRNCRTGTVAAPPRPTAPTTSCPGPAGRNLALAEEAGRDVVVPCALCFNRLKVAERPCRPGGHHLGVPYQGAIKIWICWTTLPRTLSRGFGPGW